MRKWAFFLAICISLCSFAYSFFAEDSVDVSDAKLFCVRNNEIKEITGGIKNISLQRTTRVFPSNVSDAYIEYRFNVYGKKHNIVVYVKATYIGSFDAKPTGYILVEKKIY